MTITWIETPIGLHVAATPITQSQWLEVMGTGTEPERRWRVKGDDIPATHMTWDEAELFAKKVGGRLPTSEEFLALALAGADAMPEPITDYAVCEQDEIQPVRTKLPNAWGLYDMAGLVWEWCADGPNERQRYLRGGSWFHVHDLARAVCRSYDLPNLRDGDSGFRVVLVGGPPSRLERAESMIERRLRQNVVTVEKQATRIAELEAQLDAARADLARYVAGIDAQRESGRQVLTRMLQLVEEWERADCTSSTHDCAEQVRGILRGEGPQGWEPKEGSAA